MARDGIIYKERYNLKDVTKTFLINKQEVAKTYKEIDFDNNLVTIYNTDYQLSRKGLPSTIVSLPVGDVWNKDEATSSAIYKKEYLNHISEEPQIDVNVTFDRGVAAGFENHFKLTECNTFEDLEQYGNNFFNL